MSKVPSNAEEADEILRGTFHELSRFTDGNYDGVNSFSETYDGSVILRLGLSGSVMVHDIERMADAAGLELITIEGALSFRDQEYNVSLHEKKQ